MLMTEHSRNAARARAAYQLRLHGGTEGERLFNVPPGKHSVGSGARCQIRLEAAGVGAMECLLVHDKSGLRARRWSDKTLLNGEPFDETSLADGDVLTVGPLELVVVGPPEGDATLEGCDEAEWTDGDAMRSACDALDEMFMVDEASSSSRPGAGQDQQWQSERAARPTQRIVRAPAVPSTPPDSVTKATVRRRSRRALHALRRQRQDHDELMKRVNELEQLLSRALIEPHAPQPRADSEAASDAAEFRERVAGLESKLGSLREQLAAKDGELKQARYSIDALERQLIDSQHTMHAFADERGHWEEQFNEIESRLARYVERIQELEQQLENSQASTAVESPFAAPVATEDGIDWELELGQAISGETPAPEDESTEQVAAAVGELPQENDDREAEWLEIVEESATETSEADVETVVAPPAEVAVETINAAEDLSATETEELATESAADDSADAADRDVKEALEHLRGVSIWREEPAEDAHEAAGDDSNTAVRAADKHENSAPVSFLDRYAHMFPEDDTPLPPKRTEDSTVSLKEAVPPPEVHADEESVEQYMAKLLVRMRGGPTGSSTASADADQPAEQPVAQVARPAAEETPAEPLFTNLEELKSKSAPEQPSDMAAMRALANQSARHALSLHAARKLRRTAITRVIVTALGASVSVYLLLNSSTWRSLAFAAGCAAGFAALYWGALTLGTLLKGFQLGAFDEYEEEIEPSKSLNPPLPIDVEQAPQEEAVSVESAAGESAEGESVAAGE
ncbi:MAG: hypothetical protein AB7I57_21990 [Pirellulales bacterium]